MREIVTDRLSKMEDLEQRKLLRHILTGVFSQLADRQEDACRQLEERVFREVAGSGDLYTVYASVCHREELDPIDEFLHPMLPEDALPAAMPEAGELAACLERGEEAKLQSFYMECDMDRMNRLLAEWRTFRGELVTPEGTIGMKVRVTAKKDYIQAIEKLYGLFRLNGVPWTTVNHPYAYKFIDVHLVECESVLHEGLVINEIRIHLEEYEADKRIDWIPLWNIERLMFQSSGFPIPALDKINYEHVLSIRRTGSGHGYLVDAHEEELRYVKREVNEIVIVSPKSKAGGWSMWKVAQPDLAVAGKGASGAGKAAAASTTASALAGTPEGMSAGTSVKRPEGLPVHVSNRRRITFASGFERLQAASLRSIGDVKRIVYSFEAAAGLRLDKVELLSSDAQARMESAERGFYSMNPFLKDTLRIEREKRVLLLGFTVTVAAPLVLDRISFLMSEVQRHLPEYQVMGACL
ncbi:normocyte-binding protein [Paenibacillus hexagrammi]|uniref:Normocyte-binding protein n=1 Tax=Paenibacillus hexagrammi TaxID=2908839 RepID=A0ABY3SE79_9BACL|nr:normocyte-binding protein [Paenibacillus sp. YPD9-1]UJF32216.1 normocyte-binding protein [Paenibacillus sp. YPD9-1]